MARLLEKSWAFTENDLALGVQMLHHARNKYSLVLRCRRFIPSTRRAPHRGRRCDGDAHGQINHCAFPASLGGV